MLLSTQVVLTACTTQPGDGYSENHEDLVKELHRYQEEGVPVPLNYKYRGHSEEWTADVWMEVYHLPRESSSDYVMKGKVQFPELRILKLVKGEKRQSKSGMHIDQVEGTKDFIEFCRLFNPVFAPVRPEHNQHNQLAFYHHAWLAILDRNSSTPNCEDAIAKTGSAAELVLALKSAVSNAASALSMDLKTWREMIATLVKLLTLERQKRKKMAEQHMYMEEKLTRAGKVPEMASWCAHQLQAARDTETRLSALVETLKKELTSHGLLVPS
ncbi:hypothetical protein R1sor_026725 [Riccia sorocarpa]|uniref:Uncharacterized protein n=1 Tax=Riccia sorocarpa TaxID=122646 RepID=A0ABD3GF31_9MARC